MVEARWTWRMILLLGVFAAGGCMEPRTLEGDRSSECTACHGSSDRGGSELDRAAPPTNIDGDTAPDAPGVGAHLAHLTGAGRANPVPCKTCHKVPKEPFDQGHLDTPPPAEVLLTGAATRGNRSPTYDQESGRCSDTYCHGAGRPTWLTGPSSSLACDDCHGNPPPAPHPQGTSGDCSECHHEVIARDGSFRAAHLHVNGKVEVGELACSACHGRGPSGAPAPDLSGATTTEAPGVGAHERHLEASSTHGPIACGECHEVPATVEAPGHLDGERPADVIFGTLAEGDGTRPEYDAAARRCQDVYCHGDDSPEWTRPRSGTEACGSCHGVPPPRPHPQRRECGECHETVSTVDGEFVEPELHVNGEVEVRDDGCASCHGSGERGAPAPGLDGSEDPSQPGVGAHRHHLTASTTHEAVACGECHEVPEDAADEGHLDEARPADVRLTGLGAARGASPVYSPSAGSCSDVYCHGTGEPVWTEPRDSDAACGSCHGLPPAAPHPQRDQCSSCHGTVIAEDGSFVARALHVNGSVEVTTGCSSCHGDASSAAPPRDLTGGEAQSSPGVGAHRLHVEASPTHGAVACGDCHHVPSDPDDPGHLDDSPGAEVEFAGLAVLAGTRPRYSPAEGTCAETYCHGDSTPNWTLPEGSVSTCGTCHGLPPLAPHPPRTDCQSCHADVIDGQGTFLRPELHVNGQVEHDTSDCSTCHGSAASSAPPRDLQGDEDPARRGVGAHQVHLQGGQWGRPLSCDECHVVPTALDHAGQWGRAAVQMNGPVAQTGDGNPDWDADGLTCRDSWCHGPNGARSTSPVWTGGEPLDCSSCHGLPPPPPHPAQSDCSSCHGEVVDSTLAIRDRTLHVNGSVEVELGCGSCHGDSSSAAPPPDLARSTDVGEAGVGAHRLHLDPGATHGGVPCSECHSVPSEVTDPGHLGDDGTAEVTFGPLASSAGATPTYSLEDTTCTGTYCHGSGVPDWTHARESAEACGTCHALPPSAPHPANTRCVDCHGSVVDAALTFINPALHVNGIVETSFNCTTCHGDASSAAPPVDLGGSTDPTDPGVGAHRLHLTASATHGVVPCGECHRVPTALGDAGHLDASPPAAEIWFGPLASQGGRAPAYSTVSTTCSDTYCHGPAAPDWTAPAAEACGSCHELPPPSPHPPGEDCSKCHGEVMDETGRFVNPELHVDGRVDEEMTCVSCHGSGESSAPPPDLAGLTDPGLVTVGAHQVHLAGGRFGRPVQCQECHRVPSSVEDDAHLDDWGRAEVVLSGTAATAGDRIPVWDGTTATCRDSSCHGPEGTSSLSPAWTDDSPLGCLSCHGLPLADGHPEGTDCWSCHGSVVDEDLTILDRSLHVNGTVDF